MYKFIVTGQLYDKYGQNDGDTGYWVGECPRNEKKHLIAESWYKAYQDKPLFDAIHCIVEEYSDVFIDNFLDSAMELIKDNIIERQANDIDIITNAIMYTYVPEFTIDNLYSIFGDIYINEDKILDDNTELYHEN